MGEVKVYGRGVDDALQREVAESELQNDVDTRGHALSNHRKSRCGTERSHFMAPDLHHRTRTWPESNGDEPEQRCARSFCRHQRRESHGIEHAGYEYGRMGLPRYIRTRIRTRIRTLD